jgi:putative nucleotidyltransferase with HDIG domain
VRDALLGRRTHDLDFVIPSRGIKSARRVADALGAAFYVLDEERDTGRVVLFESDGSRQFLDFSTLRGPDLESDLRARDFTINAIALNPRAPQSLIDPLGGAADLRSRQLRACSPASFSDDPLRILRGIRLAVQFNLSILPETREWMRTSVSGLQRISPERVRDEMFRLLGGPQPATSVRLLDLFNALPYTLPELSALKGVIQSPPHVSDVWEHTLSVLQKLVGVLSVLALQHNQDNAASLAMGLISIRLGRYREQIAEHLITELNPDRPLRLLLFLAALYHDTGKPASRQLEAGGRIRFFEHERIGAEMVYQRARDLRLSVQECDRLKKIVENHMRPILLAQTGQLPTRRAIYRFFRDCGAAGVDVCLLSLADVLATYETTLPQDIWDRHLEVVRTLLEALWEHAEEFVAPPALINGHDLIESFRIKPGPQIGKILEAVREAQAGGQVSTRDEALALAASLLKGQG